MVPNDIQLQANLINHYGNSVDFSLRKHKCINYGKYAGRIVVTNSDFFIYIGIPETLFPLF